MHVIYMSFYLISGGKNPASLCSAFYVQLDLLFRKSQILDRFIVFSIWPKMMLKDIWQNVW